MSQISWTASMGSGRAARSAAQGTNLCDLCGRRRRGAVTRREDVLSYRYANSTAYPAAPIKGA